ncbi:hypothetical protein LWF15_32085 [Kineosporia rhizophila]|uniref:hypothetical protein n=1 Tax=Kineosporia TaxID=49184 RepID=UPI000A798F99|nr:MULTISPECIES: hypothetical protein [Kineosporia]MCE0540143.1 hypothetical protein [Kineosporia rhizophila]GLY14355.1 hypothetical protein Kisp01_13710 [Kineosporia sp. NBRC 101677]
MTPSAALLERLLGIAEGVAAFGDQIDEPAGPRLSASAREAIEQYWEQMRTYPAGAREWRDEMFVLLLNTQPTPVAS